MQNKEVSLPQIPINTANTNVPKLSNIQSFWKTWRKNGLTYNTVFFNSSSSVVIVDFIIWLSCAYILLLHYAPKHLHSIIASLHYIYSDRQHSFFIMEMAESPPGAPADSWQPCPSACLRKICMPGSLKGCAVRCCIYNSIKR